MINRADSDRPSNLQLAFLAALVYNPVMLVIWLLYSYPLSPQCFAGPFCTFDQFPGFLQLLLVLLGMALTWFLVWVVIRIGTSCGSVNGFEARIRSWTMLGELRGVFTVYGTVLLALLLAAMVAGHAVLPVMAPGLLTGMLLFGLALSGTPSSAGIPSTPRAYVPTGTPRSPSTPPPSPNPAGPAADANNLPADANNPPPDF